MTTAREKIAAAKRISELEAQLAASQERERVLTETLNGIASADIRKWKQGYQTTDDFMTWAQSRARATTTLKG